MAAHLQEITNIPGNELITFCQQNLNWMKTCLVSSYPPYGNLVNNAINDDNSIDRNIWSYTQGRNLIYFYFLHSFFQTFYSIFRSLHWRQCTSLQDSER
jgi:hypothetical protein